MWGSVKAFLRGPVGLLAAAVSALFTAISVVQFLGKSHSAWMWSTFALAALVALSFWRFHEVRKREDADQVAAIKDLLGHSLTAGEKAVHDCHRPVVNAWRFYTRRLVAAAFGEGEAARVFHSPPNATVSTPFGDRPLGPIELGGIYVGNLQGLIGEIGNPLSVRPDFRLRLGRLSPRKLSRRGIRGQPRILAKTCGSALGVKRANRTARGIVRNVRRKCPGH
jgi:hypothetical protein